MENASKALLMAAGTLIGIMVISLAVYLFASFGSSAADINKKNEENQTNKFNSEYTTYLGRNDLTIYDIVTVVNKAKENNSYYNFTTSDRNEKTRYIGVLLDASGYLETKSKEALDQLIKSNSGIDSQGKIQKTYKCTDVKISTYTQRVYEVDFKSN